MATRSTKEEILGHEIPCINQNLQAIITTTYNLAFSLVRVNLLLVEVKKSTLSTHFDMFADWAQSIINLGT